MEKKKLELIGLNGKRGAGKSTAAAYLVKKYGFKTISFGAVLKEKAKTFFPFTPVDFSESRKEKPFKDYDWTPRDFMISLGKLARYYDENYWVKASGLGEMTGRVVVDDMRFDNEYGYIRELGGKVVRIERYEKLNIYGKDLDDPSETSLDRHAFDFRVEKCWNIEPKDLYRQLDRMMEDFGIAPL